MKKIHIGADHAGFELKQKLMAYLKDQKYEVIDHGAFEFNPDDDYPDFIMLVAKAVSESSQTSVGIVIGGGGQGEAIVCNRIKGVWAAVFYGPRQAISAVDIAGRASSDPYEQIRLSREHNNANILSLAARFLTEDEAKRAVKIFLETPFSGEDRHVRRIKKIDG